MLGTTSAGAAVLSGCSTEKVEKLIPYLVQSEDQVPGIPTWYASTCTECSAGCGLHVRDARRPCGEARGQSRAPDQQGRAVRARPGGAAGAVQPGAGARPDGEAAAARWKEISWDDAIAHAGAEAGRGERQGRGHLRRRAGHLLQLPRRLDRRRRRPGGPLPGVRPRAGARGECPRLRSRRAPGATTSARRSTSSPSARTSSRPGSPDREPARLRRVPRVHAGRASRPSLSTSRRARRSPGSTPTSGMPSCPAPRRRSPSRWPACSMQERGGSVLGHAVGDASRTPRRPRACRPRRSRAWRRSSRRRARASPWRAASAARPPAPRSSAPR